MPAPPVPPFTPPLQQTLLLVAAVGSDVNTDEIGLKEKVGSRQHKQTKAELEADLMA